jgi:hypothetical protein
VEQAPLPEISRFFCLRYVDRIKRTAIGAVFDQAIALTVPIVKKYLFTSIYDLVFWITGVVMFYCAAQYSAYVYAFAPFWRGKRGGSISHASATLAVSPVVREGKERYPVFKDGYYVTG